MRIIPYKVMGKEHQLIIAFKPDRLLIKQNNQDVMLVEKGLVSLTTQQLSSDDSFQCIVHPKMVIDGKRIDMMGEGSKESMEKIV